MQTIVKLVPLAVLVVVCTLALADTPAGVRAKFDDDTGESLQAVREHCNGAVLTLTTDLDQVDTSKWGNGRRVSPEFRGLVGACVKAIDAIDALCSSNAKSAEWKPLVAKEIKGVRCQFKGHQAQRAGEPSDVYIRRNITFDKGVLTVLLDSSMPNMQQNASRVVMRGLADKGAPIAKSTLYEGENGEQCTAWSDCKSALCVNKLCTSCANAKVSCRGGTSCHAGSCMTPAQIRDYDKVSPPDPDDRPSRTEPKQSCKARGAVVVKNDSAECCSKTSKLAKGTRTCL